MGDLKTTAEERARLVATPAAMPWVKVLYLVHDLDTLLAENARLLAVAEAARFVCSRRRGSMLPQAIDDLDKALAALEAP